jgi:hypothetical protein
MRTVNRRLAELHSIRRRLISDLPPADATFRHLFAIQL